MSFHVLHLMLYDADYSFVIHNSIYVAPVNMGFFIRKRNKFTPKRSRRIFNIISIIKYENIESLCCEHVIHIPRQYSDLEYPRVYFEKRRIISLIGAPLSNNTWTLDVVALRCPNVIGSCFQSYSCLYNERTKVRAH